MSIGFELPFSVATGSVGYFQPTDTPLQAVRQNIKSLLLTNWGERPMHYFLGCNFKEFQFENIRPDELRSRITDRVLTQIDQWLPFVTIDDLRVLTSDDDDNVPENGVRVDMKFHVGSRVDLSERLSQLIVGTG